MQLNGVQPASHSQSYLKAALLVGILQIAAAASVGAVPSFWVEPGHDLGLDLEWQAAVGTFEEADFDAYASGSVVESFTLGGTSMPSATVTPYLPGVEGQGAQVFFGSWGNQSTYGNVFEAALLSKRPGMEQAATSMGFAFSRPVYGFGLWVYDNGRTSIDSFQMTVNGVTSDILDANPGIGAHTIEGFIGVVDPAGITSAEIFNVSGSAGFEIDHFQMSTIPEPTTCAMVCLGVAFALGSALRRRSS